MVKRKKHKSAACRCIEQQRQVPLHNERCSVFEPQVPAAAAEQRDERTLRFDAQSAGRRALLLPAAALAVMPGSINRCSYGISTFVHETCGDSTT
eukprot:6191880-Pleurochrysis_carterae.AAC.4